MLKELGILIFSILIMTSQFAYAHSPKQPDTIGHYDFSTFIHIGTLTCTTVNIQVAVYGNIQEHFALVIFHKDQIALASISSNRGEEHFMPNQVGIMEQTTPELIVASPSVVDTLTKLHACKEKMGLS